MHRVSFRYGLLCIHIKFRALQLSVVSRWSIVHIKLNYHNRNMIHLQFYFQFLQDLFWSQRGTRLKHKLVYITAHFLCIFPDCIFRFTSRTCQCNRRSNLGVDTCYYSILNYASFEYTRYILMGFDDEYRRRRSFKIKTVRSRELNTLLKCDHGVELFRVYFEILTIEIIMW